MNIKQKKEYRYIMTSTSNETAKFNAVMQEYESIIKENCRLLRVEKPPTLAVVGTEDLPSPTTRFAVDEKGTSIGMNREYLQTLLQADEPIQSKWLFLSHECRHVWQVRNEKYDKDTYVTSDKTDNIAEYNSQDLELDAWAWSVYMVELKTKCTPILNSIFPKEVVTEIKTRVDKIKKEYR